jgi:hypothetical protein
MGVPKFTKIQKHGKTGNMIAKEGHGVTHHIKAVPRRITSDNVDLLVGVEPDNVFQGYGFVRPDSSRSGATNDLEIDEVDVDGVRLFMG